MKTRQALPGDHLSGDEYVYYAISRQLRYLRKYRSDIVYSSSLHR